MIIETIDHLIGFEYYDSQGRTIKVLGIDPIVPNSRLLVEREDGALWGVRMERINELYQAAHPLTEK